VTPLKGMKLDERLPTLPAINGEIMREAVVSYLACPIFRAARYEELVLDDNPYRRPVRPDDIGLVDFSTQLRRTDFAQLSSLMGHRMLLNIYDTRKLLLPRNPTGEKWCDHQQFYSQKNRFLGDLIQPYLEAHLFTFVRDEARESGARGAGEVAARIEDFGQERRVKAEELYKVISSSPQRDSVIDMLAIQAIAVSLNAGSQPPPALQGLAGTGGLMSLSGAFNAVRGTGHALLRVADNSGILYQPHGYYQYYLPSTLALMNYVNAATQHPGEVFALAGALVAHAAEARAVEDALAPALADRLDSAAPGHGLRPRPGSPGTPNGDGQVDRDSGGAATARLIEQVGGEYGVREFSRGFEEYAVLLDVHHDDRMRQFTWINSAPEHVRKAKRLQGAIVEHNLKVDLDTFVESWEECSTTHVHDEDRLLVIESGEMEFWNCFGQRHKFRPGDMTFIPRHRLHGSVVLSGECVYHQPVITPDINRRFG
jgi:mannose-6-phosphate isomerase-like protein (cupin superfamily)